MDENRTLIHYYMFTIPHITVFAGAILAILLILHIDLKKALGVFATFYGILLIIIAAIVKNHFSKLSLYRISLLLFIMFTLLGILLLIM
ncbi:hypothetical protein NF865_03595 [Thermococcus aggregans]|uniref:Uncharacterized protein n=1 Tax=Thermococcus aggregans TaxID=110163 RepID=A0A9E7SP99_THEAG|nr:hypothetical protein [Thermococcus aggregans]USS41288.1 hypothetical protein NF865_03595 [Thermococcus aggregans]